MERALSGSAPGFRPGFADGLGERVIVPGSVAGETVEALHLRSDLTMVSSFEFALRERTARLSNFRHQAFARVRQIDRLPQPDGRLAVVSDHVEGSRLSEVLTVAREHRLDLDINAALSLIGQLVHAVSVLHQQARGVAHGALALERVVVTSHARLIIVEHVLGSALERLEMTRERLWRELRIAVPPAAGSARFDHRGDVTAIGVIALALVLGRPLGADDFPHHVADLLATATENRTLGGRQPLSKPLRTWLARALQLDLRHSFQSAVEAEAALDAMLAEEPSFVAAPVALEAFLALYHKCEVRGAAAYDRPQRASLAPDALHAQPAQSSETPFLPVVAASGASDETPDTPSTDGGQVSDDATTPDFEGYPGALESLLAENAKPADVPETDRPNRRATRPRVLIAVGMAVLVALACGGYVAVRPLLWHAEAPATGTLALESQPAGLAVRIDGTPRGNTPLKMTLPPGKHRIELETGSDVRALPITITAGAVLSQYIETAATPSTGRLQVTSDPGGAIVFVDGERKGAAPLLVADLAVGRHRVELQGGEGGTVQQEVTVEAGGTTAILVPVRQAGPVSGWVTVTTPVELQVLENGQLLGTTTTERILMTAGRHQLDFVNDTLGYRSQQVVQVTGGKVAPVRVTLPTGALSVNASPWAEVWIDGQRVGETPIGNLTLPIGPHEIVFRNPDFAEQRHAVTVTLRAPARVSVDLRK